MIAPRSKSVGTVAVWMLSAVAAALLGPGSSARADLVTRDVDVTLNAELLESFDLDVDLDGTIDFTFTAALVLDPVVSVGFDVVDFPFSSSNGVVVDVATSDGFPTASRLAAGDAVSDADVFSSASFDQGNLFFFTSFDPPTGNFGGRTGFLGLRFDRGGAVVFGFAEITVNDLDAAVNPLGLTIGLVGFNDTPGSPALIPSAVPEPASAAMLGLGVAGLLGYARRRRAGATWRA